MQLIGGEVWNDGKDFGEISEGFRPVEFTCSQDGIDHGSLLRGFMRSGKQLVFSSQGNGPDGVFDQVVVNLEAAIVDIADQAGPEVECVSRRMPIFYSPFLRPLEVIS
jgi:hypothetical protein